MHLTPYKQIRSDHQISTFSNNNNNDDKENNYKIPNVNLNIKDIIFNINQHEFNPTTAQNTIIHKTENLNNEPYLPPHNQRRNPNTNVEPRNQQKLQQQMHHERITNIEIINENRNQSRVSQTARDGHVDGSIATQLPPPLSSDASLQLSAASTKLSPIRSPFNDIGDRAASTTLTRSVPFTASARSTLPSSSASTSSSSSGSGLTNTNNIYNNTNERSDLLKTSSSISSSSSSSPLSPPASQKLWMSRMTEKRARIMEHRKYLQMQQENLLKKARHEN